MPSCSRWFSLLQPLTTSASTSGRPPARPYQLHATLSCRLRPLLPPALISPFPSLYSPFLLPSTLLYLHPSSYNTFIFVPSQSTHPSSVPYFLFIPQSLSIFLPTHGTLPLILNKEAAFLPHKPGGGRSQPEVSNPTTGETR